jgi:hypothetical protein
MKKYTCVLIFVLIFVLIMIFYIYKFRPDLVQHIIIRGHLKLHKYTEDLEWQKHFFKIFRNISNISIEQFDLNQKINADRNKINEYKIINLKNLLANAKKLQRFNDPAKHLKTLLSGILPHVHLKNRKLTIEDCVIVDLFVPKGSLFSKMHTDVEWDIFNKSDGFQVWYLIENDKPFGNMFILNTNHVKTPTNLIIKKNGKINQEPNGDINNNQSILLDESIRDDPMYYLDMKPGECLIFGRNLYHLSDFRDGHSRSAINFRVVIKDKDGGIPINTESKTYYLKLFKRRISKFPQKNGKIYVGLTDLISMFNVI